MRERRYIAKKIGEHQVSGFVLTHTLSSKFFVFLGEKSQIGKNIN